jgi:hypothetical protein
MGAGAGLVAGQFAGPAINKGVEAMRAGAPAGSSMFGGQPGNGAAPGQKYAAKTGYGSGTGYTVEEVVEHKRAQEKPIGKGKITSKIPSNSPMNVDRMLQLEAAKKAEDARRAAALAPTGLMAKMPGPVQAAGRFIGGAGQAGVAPYLGRAVAGGGAGYQAVDAYNRFQQGDYPGAAISGVGALSSAASLIPTPVTRVGGAGLGIGAEMLNQYLDSLKQKANVMGQPQQQQQPMPQMARGGLVHLKKGGEPELGEARAYEPSYSEKIRDYAAKYMSPEQADRLFGGPRASLVDEFNPVGAALRAPGAIADAAKGFVRAGKEGDYLAGMGNYLVGAANVAPVIGPAARGAAKLGPKAAEMAENYLTKIGGIQNIVPPAKRAHSQHPKVAQALEEYLKGNISQADRIKIVNEFLPIRKRGELPPEYTDEQIVNALLSNKRPKALAEVPAGMRVGNRLDIPAYTQHGVYVDTTHDLAKGNAPISYNRTGHLKDVEFSSKPNQAVRVGLGTKEQALTPMGVEMGAAKSPFALIKGTNVGTKDDEVRRMMAEMLNDPSYVQIGMDPRRGSQFFNKETGMPVFATEEKFQSGPLVIVPRRGLEETSLDDPRLDLSDFVGKKYAEGGEVEGYQAGGLAALVKKLMPQAEREANKAKFLEGTKVVDYNGKPITMYHHTTDFQGDAFNPALAQQKDQGYHGQGMYFGADDYLKRSAFGKHSSGNVYGEEGFQEGSQVMPVHLSIKNPKYVDVTEQSLHGMPIEKLKEMGHDGVIVTRDDSFKNVMGRTIPRQKVYNAVAFEPTQVKSAIGNTGTYNPRDPSLTKKKGGKVKKK